MSKKYTAQCACGSCKFEFDTEPSFIANCHCKDCQKASGGAMATFFGVPQDDFTLTQGQPKAFHYVSDAGKGLDRNFCPECGARLFTSNLESFPGLVFVNLVDFDMLYGHRNDPAGYARALEEMDRTLPRILGKLRPGELAAVTADHGCDPTTSSTDHSREYVPLVVHAPGRGGGELGTRGSFADLGATVADFFGVRHETGRSFLGEVGAGR